MPQVLKMTFRSSIALLVLALSCASVCSKRAHAIRRALQADGLQVTKEQAIKAAMGAKEKNLDCHALDMCSKGKVQPFSGDVFPSAGLKASVKARTYKNELIIVSETRLNPLLQVRNNDGGFICSLYYHALVPWW